MGAAFSRDPMVPGRVICSTKASRRGVIPSRMSQGAGVGDQGSAFSGLLAPCMKLHADKAFLVPQGQSFLFGQTCRDSGKRLG